MPQTIQSESQLSLDAVIENFSHWRSTRTKKGRIPEELVEQACSLVGCYPTKKITSALGLSGEQLKKFCSRRGLALESVAKPSFVQINHEAAAIDTTAGQPIRIELIRTDGAKMQLSLSQPSAVAQLMSHFLST